jgi:hypothetical protein
MDYYTKWPEAYAIPSQDTSIVAEGLVINFFDASEYHGSYIMTRAVIWSLICYRRFCNAR